MQAQRVDDNAHLVDAWMAKGATEVLLEDTSGARRTYTQAFAEARSAHLPAKAWQAELALADLDRRAGVVATARIQFAWLGEQGSADHFAIAQELALCDIAQQQPQRALGHLQPWLAQMPSLPLELRATLLANLARVRLALGEDDAAQTLALDALALDKQAQHPPAIAADHLLLAQVMQQAGHPAQAQEHLAKAQRIRLLMGLPAAVDATADPAKAPASAGAIN
jgi:tetratricopeptide (TPR) repeat protein